MADKELLTKESDRKLALIINEKNRIESENSALKLLLESNSNRIALLENEKAALENENKKLAVKEKTLISSQKEQLSKLEARISELQNDKSGNEAILKELTETKICLNTAEESNRLNTKELIGLRSQLELCNDKIVSFTKEIEMQKTVIQQLQNQNTEIKTNSEILSSKIDSSYTAAELSEYLNNTIESFNSNENAATSTSDYIINAIDVDLKAQVFKDGENGMKFAAAKLTSDSESALSSIKISIRAIPK